MKILAGALIVVVVGVLAVVLLDSGSDQKESGRLLQQKLTATERAEARRLAAGSEELRRILRDRRYALKSVGVWDRHVVERYPQLFDSTTLVRITVDPPATLRAQWAYIGELQP